jgi:hypothetical protein
VSVNQIANKTTTTTTTLLSLPFQVSLGLEHVRFGVGGGVDRQRRAARKRAAFALVVAAHGERRRRAMNAKFLLEDVVRHRHMQRGAELVHEVVARDIELSCAVGVFRRRAEIHNVRLWRRRDVERPTVHARTKHDCDFGRRQCLTGGMERLLRNHLTVSAASLLQLAVAALTTSIERWKRRRASKLGVTIQADFAIRVAVQLCNFRQRQTRFDVQIVVVRSDNKVDQT